MNTYFLFSQYLKKSKAAGTIWSKEKSFIFITNWYIIRDGQYLAVWQNGLLKNRDKTVSSSLHYT